MSSFAQTLGRVSLRLRQYGSYKDAQLAEEVAALSSAAVAEREPVVAAWQFKHSDPISGHPVWKTTLYWNGHRATESRPLYTSPPTSELEAENARLKAILSKTIKALDVVFEDTQARTKAGMTYGIRGHPTLSIGTLHVVAQARFAARYVREGWKADG